MYECAILAGYEANTARNTKDQIIESVGYRNLQELYGYELARKNITPRQIARTMAQGIKDKDPKTRLAYLIEVKKDLQISQDTPDTMVQVNIGKELEDYAS